MKSISDYFYTATGALRIVVMVAGLAVASAPQAMARWGQGGGGGLTLLRRCRRSFCSAPQSRQTWARARRQRSLTGQSSGGSVRVGRPERVVGGLGGAGSSMAI